MLTELRTAAKVIGLRQSKKAIKEGNVRTVYLAQDAEKRVTDPIYELCKEHGIEVRQAASMTALGDAAGIEVGAAIVAVLG